jgi:hypothetical protein
MILDCAGAMAGLMCEVSRLGIASDRGNVALGNAFHEAARQCKRCGADYTPKAGSVTHMQ